MIPVQGLLSPQRSCNPQTENHCLTEIHGKGSNSCITLVEAAYCTSLLSKSLIVDSYLGTQHYVKSLIKIYKGQKSPQTRGREQRGFKKHLIAE